MCRGALGRAQRCCLPHSPAVGSSWPPLPLQLYFLKQSNDPAFQCPTPVPGTELGALPASVEEWASYSCPEEVMAVFRQDKSEFTINPSSIQRPVSQLERWSPAAVTRDPCIPIVATATVSV